MTENAPRSRGPQLRAVLAVGGIVGIALLLGGALALDGAAQILVALSGLIVLAAGGVVLLVAADRRSMERRLIRRLDALQATLTTHRESQSRHEYRHATALEQLTRLAESARGDLEGLTWRAYGPDTIRHSAERPRILFITSNGNGMGHLSRCAAVLLAGADRFDATILTLSAAAEQVRAAGLPVISFPSRGNQQSWSAWHRAFSRFLSDYLHEHPHDAVVFDGTWIFRAVTETARRIRLPLVWLARGTWKEEANRAQLLRAGEVSDLVVHPADLSPSAEVARGIDAVEHVGPIVLPYARTGLDREAACAELGLDPARRHVLVQLGSGALNPLESRAQHAIRAVHERGPEWDAAVVRYPFGRNSIEDAARVRIVSVYPLAKYLRAFDACVITAGYNSVHECLAAGLAPVIWPVAESMTDDQVLRASHVAEQGLGVMVREGSELPAALATVTDEAFIADARTRAAEYFTRDGAQQTAALLERVTARPGGC